MTDPKKEVAPAYGEGDIEAKAMDQAAKGGSESPDPTASAKVPPSGVGLPVAGTTETDLESNIRKKAEHDAGKINP